VFFPRKRRSVQKQRFGKTELLESRIVLDAGGLIWGDAPFLTLSFADDGTDVNGDSSRLFSLMSQFGTEDEWQSTILSAFETWAVQTNGDIAEVADDASPFGTDGETQGDPRFGDIRVGAIPMRTNVFGIAVSRGFIAGTWSGDILFNTNAPFRDMDEVFRVALHEAGHVFGFEHNDDPTSVMFTSGIPAASQPSPADLDELWSRFGERAPDINERDGGGNETIDDATHLSSSDSFDGLAPIIVHADIGKPGAGIGDDVDVYRFDPPDDANQLTYLGPVTIQVRTQGLSQLDPRIEVIREDDGVMVASSQQQDGNGQVTVTINLTDPDSNGRHFVTVSSANGAVSPIGSYALIATVDDWLLTPAQSIDRFAGPEFRFLDPDDLEDIFEGNPAGMVPLFKDDLHLNDNREMATPLDPVPGFDDGAKYSVLASISDKTDVDYYEIQSVDLGPNIPNVVSILVDNPDESFLDAQVELLGPDGDVLTHTNLLHHDGRTLIQLTGIEPSTTHYVRIVADDPTGPYGTGNYRLTVVAGSSEVEPNVLVSAVAVPNISEYIYRAPRPQLVTFAIDGSSNSADAAIVVSLVDLMGNTVFSFDGRTNEFFTADSVLLDRGNYRVRVSHGALAGENIDLEILAAVITDPLAVARNDSGITPLFEIHDFNDVFVFPAGGGPSPGNAVHPPTAFTTVYASSTLRAPTSRRLAIGEPDNTTGNNRRISAELPGGHDDLQAGFDDA
jgi:hypothetical protein